MAITLRTVRLIGAGAAILLMVATFLTYRLREPPTRSVDGRYTSDSCGLMVISSGAVQYADQRARFKLIFDKFGVVGELDRPLGPFYVQNTDGTKEPGWLSFDKDAVTAVRSNRQECRFKRVG